MISKHLAKTNQLKVHLMIILGIIIWVELEDLVQLRHAFEMSENVIYGPLYNTVFVLISRLDDGKTRPLFR